MTKIVRVLFVDDNVTFLTGLVRSLRLEQTLVITTARSFDGALAVLEQTAIDVLIADHEMPGRTGADLFAVVAERYPHVRRIMLTGYRSVLHNVQAHVRLSKPVTPEALLSAILAQPDPGTGP